jgi:GDP-L-fucose synthase
MEKHSKIFVAGHRGLVGSAIKRNLEAKGYNNLIAKSHSELDLMDSQAVATFFETEKPEYVFLAAAKVGGIMANNIYRAQFIYENLQIQNNIIHQAYIAGVKKLLFLGSSCVYPRDARQPIKEEYLLTNELEYTNEPYAIAKIAGMKMCESYNLQYGTDFISVMPTNLYGPNDNFHLENSHVLPALVRKMHLSKLLDEGKFDEIQRDLGLDFSELSDKSELKSSLVTYLEKYGIMYDTTGSKPVVSLRIWGSGVPMREFLWSDDMADACVFIMEKFSFKDLALKSTNNVIRNTHINIGSGKEISIRDLAFLIKDVAGFKGEIIFDTTKPDGTLRKLLDVSRLTNMGWLPKMSLKEGVRELYHYYLRESEHK